MQLYLLLTCKVRGDFVYQQVYTGNSILYFPFIQCIMSFVWNLEQAAIISLHSIFWSVFIIEKGNVCRKVKSGFLKILNTALILMD
jgi:hypothetical protein